MTRSEKIEALRELKDNWNSYGAPAFTTETIEAALLVERFLPACFETVLPGGDGNISFGINGDDVVLDLNVFEEADLSKLREAAKALG